MIYSEFQSEYINLLVKQYYEKQNAQAEIALLASGFESVRDLFNAIIEQYDVDVAVGDMLDKIGKIIGLPRAPEFETDEEYRFFIRVKIAKNSASAFMISNKGDSLQDVISIAFNGLAYVVDNYDMTLKLYVDSSVPPATIQLIFNLDLIPKPQGVRYDEVVYVEIGPDASYFGFSNNPNSKAFASKFDSLYVNGGEFAKKIIIG